jgi:hypothetical protein
MQRNPALKQFRNLSEGSLALNDSEIKVGVLFEYLFVRSKVPKHFTEGHFAGLDDGLLILEMCFQRLTQSIESFRKLIGACWRVPVKLQAFYKRNKF